MSQVPLELPLRVTVVDPPFNVEWALQLGRDELVRPTSRTATRIVFEFTVEVVEDDSTGSFRLRGPAVQGPRGKRFVYLCVGAYAGHAGTSVGGRVKVSLEGISSALLEKAKAGELTNDESEALEHYRHIGKLLELMKSRARRSLQTSPA